jgi:hypothetical protein
MTLPADPPVQVAGSDTHESQQDKEHQTAWLRAGPEVFQAPGTRFPSRQTIGLSTLAIMASGLAVTAMGHFLAPRPVTSQITAQPTAARPQMRPAAVLASNAPPTVSPAPMATNVTSATAPTAPGAPVSPASAVAPAALKPEERTLIAGGITEHRSQGRHQLLASAPSPAPALPERTAAPSSEDDDQDGAAQPSLDHQQPHWHWKKTTTCDSSGRCADHYNPVSADQ